MQGLTTEWTETIGVDEAATNAKIQKINEYNTARYTVAIRFTNLCGKLRSSGKASSRLGSSQLLSCLTCYSIFVLFLHVEA
jgi:hypothetical protein